MAEAPKQNTTSSLVLFLAGVVPVTIALLFLVTQLIKFTNRDMSAQYQPAAQTIAIQNTSGEVVITLTVNPDGTISTASGTGTIVAANMTGTGTTEEKVPANEVKTLDLTNITIPENKPASEGPQIELSEGKDKVLLQKPPVDENGLFAARDFSEIPEGPFGDSVKRGLALFMDTTTHAREFVGSEQNCSNCHLDAGRLAYSSPMWAAWLRYPKYRGKNDHVNGMEERIMGCFTYSENAGRSEHGAPPPYGHQIYMDFMSYFFWLAEGAPTRKNLEGRGYPTLAKKDARDLDPIKGEEIYEANCAICHGSDGAGQKGADGKYVFPPLWGANAFNFGAGMHRVNTAARFIYGNMPLGKPKSLTEDEAWDVAAFVNSHERPQDPRYYKMGEDLEATAKKFHKPKNDYYGKPVPKTGYVPKGLPSDREEHLREIGVPEERIKAALGDEYKGVE